MRSIAIALSVSLCLASALCNHSTWAAERPNFVIVLCDDLGYGDLECFGHPHIKTPNLNQLAATGIRLTNCYSAAPVCSPSRVGLLTGRSPNRAGVYDWIPEARNPRPDARDQVHMRDHEITIAQLLNDAGYATCMAGKWHCNSRFNDPAQPQPDDFGFDHYLATQNNAAPSHQFPKNFVRNGKPIGKVDEFSCQFVVTEALQWLDRRSEKDQPFFLYLPFHEPHEPVASPEALVAQYRNVAVDEDEAQYFANVANVDAAVGRLVKGLDEIGKRDDTLIVFTSDNGPETLDRYRSANRSHGSPGPLRGMKLHTTEAGFRVPGIVNWPGEIEPGQTLDTVVSSLDLLPTFCRLAGASIPSDLKLDGTDVLPLLADPAAQRPKPLFWIYYNAINEQRVAMRDGKWKVLAKLNNGQFPKLQNISDQNADQVRQANLTDIQIFDVTQDINESTDVSAQNPERTKALERKLNAYYKELTAHSHAWPTPPKKAKDASR
ncbi:sulfatase-like hydrolase/transferase [Rhodopirellula baltica]|uniref:Arylsulfatase A n=1 Tax=Rhodopirellula baltica WH47 TaxID=991778 RepID=F2ARK3_RHOBT|nr:sulfatase-like hydrolase/transferase [Rhodopirellula baltica]EGF27716.1 arylsulfatase A [Rhodopirellula baltica WH47]